MLSSSPLGYNISAPLDKLTCSHYVDFAECQDRFGQFSWSKNAFDYLDVKPKVFKRDDNRDFRLVQNITTGDADFKRFMQLRYQLVVAAEDFDIVENLSPVLIPTMFKDMDEQLKLAQNVIDVLDQASRKICVTLLLYKVAKPKNSKAKVEIKNGTLSCCTYSYKNFSRKSYTICSWDAMITRHGKIWFLKKIPA